MQNAPVIRGIDPVVALDQESELEAALNKKISNAMYSEDSLCKSTRVLASQRIRIHEHNARRILISYDLDTAHEQKRF